MIYQFHQFIIPAAYALLPPVMNRPSATAELLTIGLQESRFEHRQQIGGPARSFFQFEKNGGIAGVMSHPKTKAYAQKVLRDLKYPGAVDSPETVYAVIAHNDVLAAAFARLLLWTVPGRLPNVDEPDLGWDQYIKGWAPGRPHHETWNVLYAEAWRLVNTVRMTP